MGPLKMYSLLKMGIFHCYVSLPEGMYIQLSFSEYSLAMTQISIHVGNRKKGPLVVEGNSTQLCGDYFITHYYKDP